MDFSKITDEELMWEAKKRFAIPIYYNKQEAEKKIREKDDTFKGMSDDEWDNFKDDFNTGDSDQVQFDKILHDVAYFRFYDRSSICEICDDECVDYDDKLCHGCYHKSVGGDECWCASAVKKPKKKKKRKRLVIVDI